jgi:two-component system alkaline phosphatase synthesis response regulator PhoP
VWIEICATQKGTTMTTAAHILVVDDEAGVRFFLEQLLERDGHQVVAVESGEAALERIATQEFDLVLVDLRLQGIGGMDVLAAVRDTAPDTPVIVLTAYASLESAMEALRQGAHDYLFKPSQVVEVRESVRTALLKRQAALQQRRLLTQLTQHLTGAPEKPTTPAVTPSPVSGPPAHTANLAENQARFSQQGGLIVDMMRHVITLDGHMLELSPTEFALLAYLCSETPRVIPAQELVHAVQGYDCEPWEARETLRYHIHRIRQKVRHATDRADIVRTVRGVGYTLDLGTSDH